MNTLIFCEKATIEKYMIQPLRNHPDFSMVENEK